MSPCTCAVARHPEVAAIDAALLPPHGEDPRSVATRFGLSKTTVYEHRRHLLGEPAAAPSGPGPVKRAAPVSARSASVPGHSADSAERAVEGASKAPKRPQESPSRAQPQVVDSTSVPAIPPSGGTGAGTGYATAVQACAEAITRGVMRPAVLQGIGQKYGLTRDRVRHAYHEAARHLRLDMGGLLERQETTIAWVLRQRDEARAKMEAREKSAEDWRRKERDAHELAQGIADAEARIAALGEAARMGLVASKYGLEAEKWHASALAHQKHLDDIQCLTGPKELTLNQFNVSGGVGVAEFAAALAARFADRPDILAALDAAAADLQRDPADAAAILTTGEAA